LPARGRTLSRGDGAEPDEAERCGGDNGGPVVECCGSFAAALSPSFDSAAPSLKYATTRPTPQQGQRHNKAKAKAHGEPASREDGWQRGRQPEAEEHVDPTGPGSRRPRLAKVLETFEVDTAPLLGRA
tara:strand:+ start:1806 stop:2189 length:384 start_codon:yes stop_codon:yes gene_type:complete